MGHCLCPNVFPYITRHHLSDYWDMSVFGHVKGSTKIHQHWDIFEKCSNYKIPELSRVNFMPFPGCQLMENKHRLTNGQTCPVCFASGSRNVHTISIAQQHMQVHDLFERHLNLITTLLEISDGGPNLVLGHKWFMFKAYGQTYRSSMSIILKDELLGNFTGKMTFLFNHPSSRWNILSHA